MEEWKATIDWYKQLIASAGTAGVAIAAFLSFAGGDKKSVERPTVIVAYLAIFVLLVCVLWAVRAMFSLINYVDPNVARDQQNSVSNFYLTYRLS